MLSSIGAWLLSKVIGLASSDLLTKALDWFNKSQDSNLRKVEIDAEVAKEAMKTYVEQLKVESDLQKVKMQYPIFWLLASFFILPLAMWWSGVLIDSTFNLGWKVSDLPTPELRTWAGQIITFLFYSGGTVVGLKAIMGK